MADVATPTETFMGKLPFVVNMLELLPLHMFYCSFVIVT